MRLLEGKTHGASHGTDAPGIRMGLRDSDLRKEQDRGPRMNACLFLPPHKVNPSL